MGQAKQRQGEETGKPGAGRGRRRLSLILLPLIALAATAAWITMAARPSPVAAETAKPAPMPPPAAAIPADNVHAGYAGSESCKGCHAAAYEKWMTSNHHFAERPFDKGMDAAAFSPPHPITHGKQTSEARTDAAGLAEFLTQGRDKTQRPYPVQRVIGHDPLRQFLIEAPGGRMQAMELAWDPKQSTWFDVYGQEDRQPGEWGHWTGRGMNWNAQCAICHNTRAAKNYEPATDSYHTRMAEMSIGCESCHGPMRDHTVWQAQKPAIPTKDPTLKPQTRDQMLETCAACHARRGEITGDIVPGSSFHDHFTLAVPDGSDLFYPDGQIHDEDYEFTAFLGSRMHAAGVRCTDCHDPHTGKRVLEGNALCMQCHTGAPRPTLAKPAPVIDPAAHGHHGEASAGNLCTSCHMPQTTYMQLHGRHDHGFTIPDPLLTKELGIPNACARCHADKGTDWAISAVDTWYGAKMDRPTRTRARLFSHARDGDPASLPELAAFLRQPNEPLWQASATHLIGGWAGDPSVAPILAAQAKHPSPLVREAAARAMEPSLNEGIYAAALQPLLADPARSVRVAAAWMLKSTLDPKSRAGTELTHMLEINSDQPTGQMQLGQYEFARSNAAAALGHFRKAVEWDPGSPPFHHDLAMALSAGGDASGAIRELQQAVKLAPQNADYHYQLALAWNEAGSLPNAIAALETTVKLAPDMATAWYNLAVARLQAKQQPAALQAAQRAAALDPRNPRVIELLRILSK